MKTEIAIQQIQALLDEVPELTRGRNSIGQLEDREKIAKCRAWITAAVHCAASIEPDGSVYLVALRKVADRDQGFMIANQVFQVRDTLVRLKSSIEGRPIALSRKVIETFHTVIDGAPSGRLCELLSKALIVANAAKHAEFLKWLTLELNGYNAPQMEPSDIVPEYRTVVGMHYDIYQRPLVLSDDIKMLAEYRLRFTVAELEDLAAGKGPLRIEEPYADLIRKHLGVNVHVFEFSPSAVSGILAGIRSELISRLLKLKDDIPALDVPPPEKPPNDSAKPVSRATERLMAASPTVVVFLIEAALQIGDYSNFYLSVALWGTAILWAIIVLSPLRKVRF